MDLAIFLCSREGGVSRISVSRANSNVTKNPAHGLIRRPSVSTFAPEQPHNSQEENGNQQDQVNWLLGSSSEATMAEQDQSEEGQTN